MTIEITALLSTVATVAILLAVGFAARKLGFIDAVFSKKLSELIICVAQPFLIVSSILSIPYSAENLRSGATVLLVGLVVHAVAAVIAAIATHRFREQKERRLTEFALIFTNCGFLGFPILKALFGDIGVFRGSFYIIAFNVICWTYGIFVLSRADSAIKLKPLKVIFNYGTVPSAVGLLLYILRVSPPEPVMSAMNYLGSLCTPVSLLVIGGLLATIPFRRLFINLKIYLFCAIKLFLIPVCVSFILTFLGFGQEMVLLGTVMAALPTAANAAMFGETYELGAERGAHMVSFSTLLSAVTIPAVVALCALILPK